MKKEEVLNKELAKSCKSSDNMSKLTKKLLLY